MFAWEESSVSSTERESTVTMYTENAAGAALPKSRPFTPLRPMAKSEKDIAADVRQYTHSAPPRGTASRYRRYELTPARPAVDRNVSTLARWYASFSSSLPAMPAPHQVSAATPKYAAAPYADRGTPKSSEYPELSAVWHPVSGHVTSPPVSFSTAR